MIHTFISPPEKTQPGFIMVLNTRLNFLIADDHAFVREGVRRLLEKQSQWQVVAEVDSLLHMEKTVDQFRPDVIIMDYKMPDGETCIIAELLKRRFPSIMILILTSVQSGVTLQKVVSSSIDALLLKEGTTEELLKAIDSTLHGKRYISELVKPYIDELSIALTGRELQVLNMITMGLTRTEISEQLELSTETIKTYRKNIMRKLNVNTATGLIIKAKELKLIDS